MNAALASQTIEKLMASGVSEFCLCPGARNSPLIDFLHDVSGIRRWNFFEERSAAFFALGRIKATGRPVAVVATSGTAAGELLPATMEAHYSALPLVLITADRPRRFRGSGAPQTAEQPGIFGPYAQGTFDFSGGEFPDFSAWAPSRPLHLNLCFEEPLLGDRDSGTAPDFAADIARSQEERSQNDRSQDDRSIEDMRINLKTFLGSSKNPLFLVGSLSQEDRPEVLRFLERLRVPTYLEAPSGLREEKALIDFRVHGSDGLLARARATGYAIDSVLRIGGVPTLRLWRDLEALGGKIPVLSMGEAPFSGLSWGKILRGSPAKILPKTLEKIDENVFPRPDAERFLRADHALQDKVRALFHREPRSEPALVHALSRAIPHGARVFLGNSLPIREWDLAATFSSRGYEVAASRGLNGIDGQTSTFYGFSQPDAENWALLGDLTALYDLSAPWILDQLGPRTRTNLVVLNNQGGKIFSRMFQRKEFQNAHELDFSAWAKLWKIRYERWEAVPELGSEPREHRIIELRPDGEASSRFWDHYAAACAETQK